MHFKTLTENYYSEIYSKILS